jgi:hypothetical protein
MKTASEEFSKRPAQYFHQTDVLMCEMKPSFCEESEALIELIGVFFATIKINFLTGFVEPGFLNSASFEAIRIDNQAPANLVPFWIKLRLSIRATVDVSTH